MQQNMRTALIVATLGVLAMATLAGAADWPNWRGPNHDGMSSETGLRTAWEAPPPTLWQREIGSGFSAIVCVGEKAYTCGTQEGQQVIFCLNADTGEVIWQKAFEKGYRDRQGGDGTRGTPTVDENRVYIQGARGRLICFDANDGKEVWSRQFSGKPQWGYAGSVLIEGDLAIANGGDGDGPLIALDKKTGKTVWKRGRAPAGYSTPYPFTFEDRRYVVGFLGKSIIIVDVKAGREVWNMPWQTDWDVNAATPIFHDDHLFLSSGYGHGSILLKLAHSGNKLTAKGVWPNESDKSIVAKFQSPVLYQGHLYTSDESNQLKCVEFTSGKVKWTRRGIRHGTVVIADGHLFVLTEQGKLLIGKVSPEGFEPTTDVQILKGRCWTIPTLYKGRIYARDFKRVVCLDITR